MRLVGAILSCMGAVTIGACSNATQSPDDAARAHASVMARFESLTLSVLENDHAEYLAHFDRDRFTALNADGTVTHDFEAFGSAYRRGAASIGQYHSLEFENVKVSILDPTVAVLVNEYSAEVELTNGDVVVFAGAGTQVWHKSNNEWMLSHVSSSTRP